MLFKWLEWKPRQWLRFIKIHFITNSLFRAVWSKGPQDLLGHCWWLNVQYCSLVWLFYFRCRIDVAILQPVTCEHVHDIEETVTDESSTDDEDIHDKIRRRHWQTMLHCVWRMPFGACQNEGNHCYLIFIKYHDDNKTAFLKIFL